MIMVKLLMIPLVLILAFVGLFIPNSNQYRSKGEQLVYSTLGEGAKLVREKYHLRPSGSGVAMPGGPIRELCLSFDMEGPVPKKTLRKLLLAISQDLVQLVTANEEIQPFLFEPPFTVKNVQVILYVNRKGYDVFDPDIAVAEISRGNLSYRTLDPDNDRRFKQFIKETYEEALEAAQEDNDL
ncbi:Uncharacterized protein PHSC3_000693 [Chlamydiales bacterium STE3]|nr:Uncharacterized protein PHSC3_000693 [Chlamydiales bacterium STE3]